MQTLETLLAVLEKVTYKDLTFSIVMDGERPILQIVQLTECSVEKTPYYAKGRKWFLSYHMTDSELVQTAFAAVKMFEEHEMREHFKFWNIPLYKPHYSVYDLLQVATTRKSDKRK